VAVDTLPTSNADVEGGFGAANNTVIDGRNMTTTKCHQLALYQHTCGAAERKMGSRATRWLGKERRAAHATNGTVHQNLKEDNYFEYLWKSFE